MKGKKSEKQRKKVIVEKAKKESRIKVLKKSLSNFLSD
jgi:hypothetical protein